MNSVKVFIRSSELCPHLFIFQNKHEQNQQPWTIPSVILFVWWVWWTASCYWRKESGCQNHSLRSFHGIHHFCWGHHYLWHNIKGPSESVKLLKSFLEEGISITPVGKRHTMHFLYHVWSIFGIFWGFFFNIYLFWYLTCRNQLNWNIVEMHCLQILVCVTVAKMT